MPAEMMLSYLRNCSPEGRLGFQVAMQCAPVLKDVKISNLIIVKPGGWHKRKYCFYTAMSGWKTI